jgi:hypothetical protein
MFFNINIDVDDAFTNDPNSDANTLNNIAVSAANNATKKENIY